MFITPDEIGGREAEPILLVSNSEGVECYRYLLNPFGVPELDSLGYPPVSLEVMNI